MNEEKYIYALKIDKLEFCDEQIKGTNFQFLVAFNPFEPEFTIVISSTTSRELLPQFSTCSGWRWLEVGGK